MNSTDEKGLNNCCGGRGMRMRRGHAAGATIAPGCKGISHEPLQADEKSCLEETARRLEEELRSVIERIEKLQPVT